MLVADLGAVFVPQQHEGHALASQLLVDAPVVGPSVGVAGSGRRQQAALQGGFVHASNGRTIQASGYRQAHIFGDHAFGDTKGKGDLLVGQATVEFETQGVFEFAHIDP